MKEERKFLRLCNSCRQYKQKSELIKLTKDYKTGEVCLNIDNKIQGRSLYICKSKECIEKFIKNKKKTIALKAKISEKVIELIKGIFT